MFMAPAECILHTDLVDVIDFSGPAKAHAHRDAVLSRLLVDYVPGMEKRALILLAVLGTIHCGGGGEASSDDAGTPLDAGRMDAGRSDAGAADLGPEPCFDCVVLSGGLIFDGNEARAGSLVIREGHIDRLLFGEDPPPESTIVDVTGKTILPGLIDAHVHSFVTPGPPAFVPPMELVGTQIRTTLRAGVTGILDLGSPLPDIFLEQAQSMRNDHPRMFVAGPMITAPDGHPCTAAAGASTACLVIDGPAAVDAAIDDLASRAPNVLKMIVEPGWRTPIPTLDAATVQAVIAAAQRVGKPLLVHATRAQDLSDALLDGARLFAHLPFQDRMLSADADMLAQDNATVIPTLSFVDSLYRLATGQFTELADPNLPDDVHPDVIAALGDPAQLMALTSTAFQALVTDARANAQANFATCLTAGVKMVAGTDAGNPGTFHGLALRRELALYVANGMTPAQAINTATKNAADLLGRSDLGRLEVGAIADLLILDANPLADINALAQVSAVYKGGVLIDREALKVH